jgi:cytochrome c
MLHNPRLIRKRIARRALVRAERCLSPLAKRRLLAALIGALGFNVVTYAAIAAGDPVAGSRVFARCAICHTAEPGKHKVGPSLFNLIGRPAGTAPGYSYSAPMHDLDKIWDAFSLDEYLVNPKAMVPGTKMIFPGLTSKQQRDDVIAFLSTLHATSSDR